MTTRRNSKLSLIIMVFLFTAIAATHGEAAPVGTAFAQVNGHHHGGQCPDDTVDGCAGMAAGVENHLGDQGMEDDLAHYFADWAFNECIDHHCG